MTVTEDNLWGVHDTQWEVWSPAARKHFNAVFECLIQTSDYDLYLRNVLAHDMVLKGMADREQTLVWNAAWVAADQIDRPGTIVSVANNPDSYDQNQLVCDGKGRFLTRIRYLGYKPDLNEYF